jgi:superfamily II DNA or RNA helicase
MTDKINIDINEKQTVNNVLMSKTELKEKTITKKSKKSKNSYTTTLSRKGYSIPLDELDNEELEKIKKKLTIFPKSCPGYGPEDTEPYILFKIKCDKDEEGNDLPTGKIYMPKYYGIKNYGEPKKNKLKAGETINCKFNGQMRQYQKDILSAWDDYAKKYGGGIISVGPGRGKTVMAIKKIEELGLKTLILVHTSDLLTQWIERIEQYLPTANIGIIQGKTINTEGKDIVIGMIQSISAPTKDKDYPPELFKQFGLVIIDECHHIGAKQFSRCLNKTVFKYTMGLSATPNRPDGMAKIFKYYLGDICYKDTEIQKTDEEKALDHIPDAEVRVYEYFNYDPDYCNIVYNYQKKPMTTIMESNMCDCQRRTEFILSLLPSLIAEGRKIIVLVSRKTLIADLMEAILERSIATVGAYIGGMKPAQLAESKTKQILVATYKMAEEGFDCQSLDTLIMATPKTRIEQSTGRIMRKKKNERTFTPLIIDIADQFSNFISWHKTRMRFYKDKNYKIKVFNVIDDEDSVIENDEGDMPAIIKLKKDYDWQPPEDKPLKTKKGRKKQSVNSDLHEEREQQHLNEMSMFDLS